MEWEYVFSHHISDKILVSKIYEEHTELSRKKYYQKVGRGSEQTLSNENIGQQVREKMLNITIRKIQVKTPVRYHFIPGRKAAFRKPRNNKC